MRRLLTFAVLAASVSVFANPIADAPSRWTTADSGKVHYKSWRKGRDALVLIHGWTCDMQYFAEQVPHFAKRMRVIAVDLPGHGRSDAPQTEYTQALFAESIARVLDHARVERAVLVGHSMGTPVARQFYRMYRDRTLGIVALDGSVRAMSTDPKRIEGILSRLRGPEYKQAATAIVDGMLAAAPETPYKSLIRDTMLGTPQHVAAGAAAGMFDLSIWKDDPIEVPVLLLNAKSPSWTGDYETYARKLIPNVDYVVLDGVSHFLHTEKPAEVNARIDTFLAKNRLLGRK